MKLCFQPTVAMFEVWRRARTWLSPHIQSLPSENHSRLPNPGILVYRSVMLPSTTGFHGQSGLLSTVAVQSLLPRFGNHIFSKISGSIAAGRTSQTWVLEHYQFLQLSAVSWALLSNMQLKPLPRTASSDSRSHLWLPCFYWGRRVAPQRSVWKQAVPAPPLKGACGICLSERAEAVEKEREKCRTSAGMGDTA